MIKCTAGLPRPRKEDLIYDEALEEERSKAEQEQQLEQREYNYSTLVG